MVEKILGNFTLYLEKICGIPKLISRTFECENFIIINIDRIEITWINLLKEFYEELDKILQKI